MGMKYYFVFISILVPFSSIAGDPQQLIDRPRGVPLMRKENSTIFYLKKFYGFFDMFLKGF